MALQEKQISDRIKVIKDGNVAIQIEISQRIPRWQESLLLAWLGGWTYCGGVFIYYAIVSEAMSDRIFFIISSSAFMYFFVRIVKVFLWRVMGKEKLSISSNQLVIQNAFGQWGRKETLKLSLIQKMGIIKADPANFFAFLDDSFWVMGGERVGFVHGSTKYRIGKQLSVKESELLVQILDSGIRAFRKQ
jgi:hypothetical protein